MSDKLSLGWFRLSGWLESHGLGRVVVLVEVVRAKADMTWREWLCLVKGGMQ